jgi:hypothetical protein
MANETCILCASETPYHLDVNIEYRTGYIEGAGQLCERSWDKGTKPTSILISTQTIKDTPNDMELGKLVRSLYHQTLD